MKSIKRSEFIQLVELYFPGRDIVLNGKVDALSLEEAYQTIRNAIIPKDVGRAISPIRFNSKPVPLE